MFNNRIFSQKIFLSVVWETDPKSFVMTVIGIERKYASLGVSSCERVCTAVLCHVPLIIFKVLMRWVDDTWAGYELYFKM